MLGSAHHSFNFLVVSCRHHRPTVRVDTGAHSTIAITDDVFPERAADKAARRGDVVANTTCAERESSRVSIDDE
jgi:hypothetical protein